MKMHAGLALLCLGLGCGTARAQPVQVSYAAYAAGLNVINMEAAFDVQPERYRVHLNYRTAGAFGLVVRGQQETSVEGRFVDGKAVPQRFYSAGTLRGKPRLTNIEYPGGNPAVRQLVPPNEEEREPVPASRQAGTIDTMSAMAQLVHQVNQTGRCEGKVTTFDGRRLSELNARTVSQDLLPRSSLSSFAGQALHCDFEGRLLAGFTTDHDKETQQRPQHGSAWFASLTPGGKLVPVRIAFHTRFFGDATMYIVQAP